MSLNKPLPSSPTDAINKKLKDYLNYRKNHSIESLIQRPQTLKSEPSTTNPKLSTFNRDPPTQKSQKRISVLLQRFQKVEAHTEAQSHLIRMTNKDIDNPGFKARLMHGLTNLHTNKKLSLMGALRPPTETDLQVARNPDQENVEYLESLISTHKHSNPRPKSTKVLVDSRELISPAKQFNQLTHLFTPFGPARSRQCIKVKQIVSSNFKEKPTVNRYREVTQQNITKVQNYLNQQSTGVPPTPKRRQSKAQSENTVMKFFTNQEFHEDPTLTYGSNSSHQSFVREMKHINTIEMKLDKSKSQFGSRPQTGKTSTSIKQSAIKDLLQKPKEILMANDVPIKQFDIGQTYEDERKGFSGFIQNKWIQFIIENKSICMDDEYHKFLTRYQSDTELVQSELQVLKKEKDLRQSYRNLYQITQQTNDWDQIGKANILPKEVRDYLKYKSQQYSNTEQNQQKKSIKLFNNKLWEIRKAKDEEDLIEFDQYYKFFVKRRRIKVKLRMLAKKAQELKCQVGDLVDRHLLSSKPYERKGSFAFFEYVKQGNVSKVQTILNETPQLVNEQNDQCQTPIFIAVRKRNVLLVKVLLEYGAEVNIRDDFQLKPLSYACMGNDTMLIKVHRYLVIQLLLSWNANPWDVYSGDFVALCVSPDAKALIKIAQYMSIVRKQSTQSTSSSLVGLMEVVNGDNIFELLSELRRIV